MTKRFTIFGEWHKDNVIDEIRDNTGEYVTLGRCVDLLNENEQLKSENMLLTGANKILKENNKRIKQSIREAMESERTQIGQNVLKQLLEQIQ